MSEDNVLAQLRDIHLPAGLGAIEPTAFAAWPFIALAVVLGVILVVRFWRHNRWRRSAKADFARIVEIEDHAAQWSMLLAFAAGLPDRARRPITLPNLAYRLPESVSETEKAEFITYLNAELGR